jgi:hypothetical protein
MAKIPIEYLNEINRILSAIRSSFDFNLTQTARSKLNMQKLRDCYFRFEEIRFEFRSGMVESDRRGFDQVEVIQSLRSSLERLLDFDEFDQILEVVRLRPTPFQSRTSREPILHPALYDQRLSVFDGIRFLLISLDDLPKFDTFAFEAVERQRKSFDASAIRKVVPTEQGLAPLKFDVIAGKIVILPQQAELLEEDENSVSSAKSSLLTSGAEIIGELEKSNCDKRLLENIKGLQTQLEAQVDIIKLGLANIGTEMMCNAFSHELPDAVLSMVRAHNVGVSMYVGQFTEWQRFSEKAALSEISTRDVETIYATATQLVENLSDQPTLADPEVPRTLAALNRLLTNPKQASKRAAFAVLRSIENLVIKVFNYGTDMIETSVEKIIDKTSTAVARSVTFALIGLALTSAVSLSPVATHVPSSAWITKAIEVIKKQIENID